MIGEELKRDRDEDPVERSGGGDEWGDWLCCYFVGTNRCNCVPHLLQEDSDHE